MSHAAMTAAHDDARTFEPQRLFVHVGYQRTGTSFLQTALFSELCPARRIAEVPVIDNAAAALSLKSRHGWTAYVDDRFALFSCEEIVANLEQDEPGNAEILAREVPGARIIISIRSQYSLFRSLYFLYVKSGGRESFAEFVRRRAGALITYNQTIRRYRDLFGADNVHVLLHEDLVQAPGETMRALLTFLGRDPALVERVKQVRVKPSAPDMTVRLLHFRNLLIMPAMPLLPPRVSRAVYRTGLPGSTWLERRFGIAAIWTLPVAAVRAPIHDAYAVENASLFAMLGKDITAYDYPQPGKA